MLRKLFSSYVENDELDVDRNSLSLRLLNSMLTVDGSKVDIRTEIPPESCYNKAWRKFLQIIFWIYLIPAASFDFRDDLYLPKILAVLYFTLSRIIQLYLCVRRKRLTAFISLMSRVMTRRQKLIIDLAAFALFAHLMIFLVHESYFSMTPEDRIARVPLLRPDFPHAGIIAYIAHLLILLIYHPSVLALTIYTIVILLTYFHIDREMHLLSQAARYFQEDQMIRIAERVGEVFSTFEDLFSFFALAAIRVTFAHALHHLHLFMMNKSNISLTHLCFSLFQQSFLICLIFVISFISDRIKAHRRIILTQYLRASRASGRTNCLLIRLVEEATSCRFTVWGMMKIDRSIVLSYISTVVTFEALCFQFFI